MPSWSVSLSLTHHTRHTRHQRTTQTGYTVDRRVVSTRRKKDPCCHQTGETYGKDHTVDLDSLSIFIYRLPLSRSPRGASLSRRLSLSICHLSLSSLWVVSLRSPSKSDSSTGPFFSLSRSGFFSLSPSLSISRTFVARFKKRRDKTKQAATRASAHTLRARENPPAAPDRLLSFSRSIESQQRRSNTRAPAKRASTSATRRVSKAARTLDKKAAHSEQSTTHTPHDAIRKRESASSSGSSSNNYYTTTTLYATTSRWPSRGACRACETKRVRHYFHATSRKGHRGPAPGATV